MNTPRNLKRIFAGALLSGGVWLEQYGVYNYIHMKPADDAQTCDAAPGLTGAVKASTGGSDDSSSTGPFLIVVGGLIVVALVGGGVVMMRRRQTVSDRE